MAWGAIPIVHCGHWPVIACFIMSVTLMARGPVPVSHWPSTAGQFSITRLPLVPQGWSFQVVSSLIPRGAEYTTKGVLVPGLEAMVTWALRVELKMVGGLSAPPGLV